MNKADLIKQISAEPGYALTLITSWSPSFSTVTLAKSSTLVTRIGVMISQPPPESAQDQTPEEAVLSE